MADQLKGAGIELVKAPSGRYIEVVRLRKGKHATPKSSRTNEEGRKPRSN